MCSTCDSAEHVRYLMGYVVDLTLILQAAFLVSLQDHSEGKVTVDRVNEIIYEFYFSEKKKRVHNAIWDFQPSFSKGDVVDKIESLLKENEVCKLYFYLNPLWSAIIDDEDWYAIWPK